MEFLCYFSCVCWDGGCGGKEKILPEQVPTNPLKHDAGHALAVGFRRGKVLVIGLTIL